MSNPKQPAGGLTAIRRFYFYIVAFVSLVAGLAALDKLLEALDTAWLGGAALFDVGGNAFTREVLAASGGVLLVAAPIFLLHWRFIQQRQDDPDERHSGLRKFFLYLASAVAIGFVLFRAYDLLYGVAALAFGQPLASSKIWPDGWLYNLLMIAAAWSLEAYLHHVVVADGDYGRERDNTGVWRRLFQVAAGLVGLGLILYGAANLLETAWRTATGGIDDLVTGWWRPEAWAHGAAILLIGAVLARINWRRWRAITVENADEARSALRRFYLYVAVAAGAVAALAPAASILREVLLIVFGSGAGDAAELLRKLATPISFVPVGAVIWLWHRRFLQREAEEYGESEEGAAVRRLYYYVLAATGLTLLWFGAVNIVGAALDWLLRNGVQGAVGGLWAEPLATGLSLLTVGAPVWALHWRAVQRVAQEEDAAGLAERTSLTRRAYLYGVALVGALLILFYLARVVYRVLLFVLGDPNAGVFSAQTVDEMARAAISALLWGVHILAIRTDGRMGEAAPPPETETVTAADAADERVYLAARIADLERELAATRAALQQLEAAPGPAPDAPP